MGLDNQATSWDHYSFVGSYQAQDLLATLNADKVAKFELVIYTSIRHGFLYLGVGLDTVGRGRGSIHPQSDQTATNSAAFRNSIELIKCGLLL